MTHVLRLPFDTSEKLQARVIAGHPSDSVNVTAFPVAMALIARDLDPAPGDWQTAAWVAGGPPYYAERLFTPVVGTWGLWVRVITASETVVRQAGLVEFYVGAP